MPAQKKQKDTVSKHMSFRYVEHFINRVPNILPVRRMDTSGSANVRPEPLVMTLFRPPPDTNRPAFFNPETESQEQQQVQQVKESQQVQKMEHSQHSNGTGTGNFSTQPQQAPPAANSEDIEEMDWSSD